MRRLALVLISLFMLSIVPGTAIAQESVWADMAPATSPPARGGHRMVYDAESDRIVLFGGVTRLDSGQKDDTWAYDFNANTWSDMNPGTRPSTRWGHAMAYDAESDRVILFGGTANSPETWAYDFNANTWSDMSPAIQPTAWSFADMAYDVESDRIVLFGGCAAGSASACSATSQRNETWVYDYNANTWMNINPGTSPSVLFHRMAYDEGSDRIVLFGGFLDPAYLADTWAYNVNANLWTEMNPQEAPSGRSAHGMAYDANADRIILFGGSGVSGGLSDTWTYNFDNDTWSRMDSDMGPSRRGGVRLAFDTESDRTVLFGGLTGASFSVGSDETWALVPPPPPPPDLLLVYIAIGVVAAAVVAVVAIALTRRRSRMRKGGEGE